MEWFSLLRLYLESVILREAYENIVVGFGKVVDDTINVRFDILWTLDEHVLICCNVQGVGNAKVIPEEFV